MIAVDISEGLRGLLDQVGISDEMIIRTLNDRDKGVLDADVSRLIAVHWFSDDQAVFVDAAITHKSLDGNQVTLERARAMLAIFIGPKLPLGRNIHRGSELEEIMIAVAESFGNPVSFHEEAAPVTLYSGPWDGQPVKIAGVERGGQAVLVLATLNQEKKSAFAGWAFNLQRYLSWWQKGRSDGKRPPMYEVAATDTAQEGAVGGTIRFTDDQKENLLKRLGIRTEVISEVLEKPDKTDNIDFQGSGLRLHTKLIESANPPYVLLVVEMLRGEERLVGSAFKIYPQLARNWTEARPLDLLRALTDSFGILIRVGKQTRKLVLCESFPFRAGDDIVQGVEPIRGSIISEITFMFEEAPNEVCHCAMAFCIDEDLYSTWLRAMSRKVN